LEEALGMGHWEWGRIPHRLASNDLLSLHWGGRSPGGQGRFQFDSVLNQSRSQES
jgi:hypothetical protein